MFSPSRVPDGSARRAGLSMMVLCTMLNVVACRRAQEPVGGSLPRCYRLAVGPWEIPQRTEYPEQRLAPPTPQLLVLEPARTEWVIGMAPNDSSPWRRLGAQSTASAWTAYAGRLTRRRWRIDGDSLFASFTTSTGGLGMRFRILGDSLLGKAEVVSDAGRGEYPTAPATGTRVSCPGR